MRKKVEDGEKKKITVEYEDTTQEIARNSKVEQCIKSHDRVPLRLYKHKTK